MLSGGTVIDGYGNAPIPDGIVVIEGDRILAVGGAGQVAIPEGAEIVSTEGMTVLPGLWDMQVDLMRLGHGDARRWNETYGPLAERVVMPIAARQLLQAGVTSARDVAAPLEAATRVRGRVREKIIDGPSLYVSGPALRKLAPAGTGAWQWEVAGAPDVRAKVQRLANAGVDYLLLADLELWTAEELEAVVSEARIRGLPVHAIADKPADVVRGAAAQLDGFLGTVPGAGPYPAEMMQAITGRLTQAGARPMAWTPAISAPLNLESLKANDEPLDDPRATAQLPELVAADVKGSLAGLGSATPGCGRGARAVREARASSTRRKCCCCSAPAPASPATCTRARPGRRSTSGCATAACRPCARSAPRPTMPRLPWASATSRAQSRPARSRTSSPCAATCCATPRCCNPWTSSSRAGGGCAEIAAAVHNAAMTYFILRVLIAALGLWLATEWVAGITVSTATTLIFAALLLGVVNAIVRPIVVILTLPFTLRDARPVPAGRECRDARAWWPRSCRASRSPASGPRSGPPSSSAS